MRFRDFPLTALVLVAACNALPPASPRGPQPHTLTHAERNACLASNGETRRGGMFGGEFCVHRYADAGKACTDRAQCQGACYWMTPDGPSRPPPPPGEVAVGQCAADDSDMGCWILVEGGKIGRGLCVD